MATKKTMKRSRNWCFTDFEILDFISIYKQYSTMIRYICVGEESCPETDRKHLQGWVQFNKPKRMSRVKSLFGSKKIHLEMCRGDEFSNDNYCKKDNKFMSFGKFVAQGQRTDMECAIQELFDGGSMHDLAMTRPQLFVQYGRRLRALKAEYMQEQTNKLRTVHVEYVWGGTGTGKSHYAYNQKDVFGKRPFFIDACDLKWWDGYNGEKTIVIDEYSNDIKVTKLLKLLDKYPKRLEIKGGITYANWTRVIITSNLSPDELHPLAKEQHRVSLNRRIAGKFGKIIHLTKKYDT